MTPPNKSCLRCNGTGRKFSSPCSRCSGSGVEPPQAKTQMSVEAALGLETTPSADQAPSQSSDDLLKLRAQLEALKDQVSSNRISINNEFTQSRAANLASITALSKKIDAFSDDIYEIWKKTDDAIAEMNKVRPVSITITSGPESWTLPEGHRHPQFETLLRAASSREPSGLHPNIWIAGPAGSGKTTGGRMLAKALNLPFYFNGAVSMEHKLIGFRDANGTYHDTPFRQGFTQPAVYQFDDVDSSDNQALLALNAALANGECDFADKLMPRHPDSIILATANTWGLGATSDYVGRVKIDAAFLSRFPVKILWPYDEPFERAISGNVDWAIRVQTARKAAHKAGLKVIIDPRHTLAGAALIAAGFTPDSAAELTYLANLRPEDRSKIYPQATKIGSLQ